MSDIYDIDPLKQAFYDVVHDFPGKVPALAKRLNTNAGSLQNKVNRNNEHLYPNVSEFRATTLITQDFRALDQLNIDCGRISVPLPENEFPADLDLVQATADWQREVGETAGALHAAVKGEITRTRVRKLRQELIEDYQRGLALVMVLEGMAEPEPVTNIKEARRG